MRDRSDDSSHHELKLYYVKHYIKIKLYYIAISGTFKGSILISFFISVNSLIFHVY